MAVTTIKGDLQHLYEAISTRLLAAGTQSNEESLSKDDSDRICDEKC